ncbi:MAG: hypothetical protein LBJ02_11615 [Bifidobacteriaceae bacterium]|nr:hypothetical protein [Bifidobacteriaceae bacterium]
MSDAVVTDLAPAVRQPVVKRPTFVVLSRALAVALVAGLLLTAYLWATTEAKPRDVPLGIVGPGEAVTQIEGALGQAIPGGFAVRQVDSADQARELVRQRELYGALVLEPTGMTLVTASAASAPVARLLEALPGRLASAGGPANVTVEDLVPLPSADPNGSGFGLMVILLSLVGLLSGALTVLTVRGWRLRAVTAVSCGVAIGLTAAALAGPWLGVLPNGYWANAGLIALGCSAVALSVVGAHGLGGAAAMPVVALLVFGGNPFSGAQASSLMLPEGWAQVGQVLPPGALASALRSQAYFGGTGAGGGFAILGAWAVAGIAALMLGAWLRRSREHSYAAGTATAAPGTRILDSAPAGLA